MKIVIEEIDNILSDSFKKYNDEVYIKYNELEELKNKFHNKELSRIKRDEIYGYLSQKLNDFHIEFLNQCENIIKDTAENFLFEAATESNIELIKQNTYHNLYNFVNYWIDKINPIIIEKTLFNKFNYDNNKINQVKHPHSNYIEEYYGEVVLNDGIMWNYILSLFGLKY